DIPNGHIEGRDGVMGMGMGMGMGNGGWGEWGSAEPCSADCVAAAALAEHGSALHMRMHGAAPEHMARAF
ncbi:hypothetical protein, partial [Stenotrophomonas tumulicola]